MSELASPPPPDYIEDLSFNTSDVTLLWNGVIVCGISVRSLECFLTSYDKYKMRQCRYVYRETPVWNKGRDQLDVLRSQGTQCPQNTGLQARGVRQEPALFTSILDFSLQSQRQCIFYCMGCPVWVFCWNCSGNKFRGHLTKGSE